MIFSVRKIKSQNLKRLSQNWSKNKRAGYRGDHKKVTWVICARLLWSTTSKRTDFDMPDENQLNFPGVITRNELSAAVTERRRILLTI